MGEWEYGDGSDLNPRVHASGLPETVGKMPQWVVRTVAGDTEWVSHLKSLGTSDRGEDRTAGVVNTHRYESVMSKMLAKCWQNSGKQIWSPFMQSHLGYNNRKMLWRQGLPKRNTWFGDFKGFPFTFWGWFGYDPGWWLGGGNLD